MNELRQAIQAAAELWRSTGNADDRAALEEAIRAARGAGAPTRELAAASGLPRSEVNRIAR